MRAFGIDIIKTISEIRIFLSEFSNFGDFFEFISELNELRDVVQNDILGDFMDNTESQKLLEEFILLVEEQLQNDLNKLSSLVDSMESEVNRLNTPPHTYKHSPE